MLRSVKIPNVRFNLKDRTSQNNETLIYAIFNYGNKQRLKYSTSEKVPPKYWDQKSGKVKNVNSSARYIDINDRLNEISKLIISIYKENDFGEIEPKDFRDQLNIKRGKIEKPRPKKKRTFIEFIEAYIKQRKESPKGERGTWKTWLNNLNLLKEYLKEKGFYNNETDSYAFEVEDITWDFRIEYENWLYGAKNHSINYASKVIQVFTQFLNESNRRREFQRIDIHKDNKSWHIEKVPSIKFRLTFPELEMIHNCQDYEGREQIAADLFLIGAYTGLRYSDFSRLKPEYIKEDEGIKIITIRTKKTKQDVEIPIYPIAEAILQKYDFNPPKMPSASLNSLIKDVAKKAGINREVVTYSTRGGIQKEIVININDKISSHVARRSFASNFSELGIPAIKLMMITGHTTQKQFSAYICIDATHNAKELYRDVMNKMNWTYLKVV